MRCQSGPVRCRLWCRLWCRVLVSFSWFSGDPGPYPGFPEVLPWLRIQKTSLVFDPFLDPFMDTFRLLESSWVQLGPVESSEVK